ncbi:MAG: PhnD/SsuA/transferrin family substrate-binding protein [Anaerolineae bacterium]|nr:PhnD/SsuA/transferrin family substrate-binding protein [Anaerolineae bacterium]
MKWPSYRDKAHQNMDTLRSKPALTVPEFGQPVARNTSSPLTAKPRPRFQPKTLSSLKVISIQSENADDTCRHMTQYLGEQLGIETEFIDAIPWQEREHLLDTQQAHLGWICGLPYIWKADREHPHVELVAAPVMQNFRYRQQPIYYSDVIVHKDSDYQSFEDLRGASWSYNEPHSQSGHNITRYHLAKRGEYQGYFGRVIEAGSHLKSLELLLENNIAATAIDSTVLETEFAARPYLREQIRVIETLRPSPMPPWVVTKNVPPPLREAIRQVFLSMHKTEEGRAILKQGQIQKLARVDDHDYDSIRDMAQLADQVKW